MADRFAKGILTSRTQSEGLHYLETHSPSEIDLYNVVMVVCGLLVGADIEEVRSMGDSEHDAVPVSMSIMGLTSPDWDPELREAHEDEIAEEWNRHPIGPLRELSQTAPWEVWEISRDIADQMLNSESQLRSDFLAENGDLHVFPDELASKLVASAPTRAFAILLSMSLLRDAYQRGLIPNSDLSKESEDSQSIQE